jgi:pilus assembly protein CpaC
MNLSSSSASVKFATLSSLLFLVLFTSTVFSWGSEIKLVTIGTSIEKSEPQKLQLITGKSIILKTPRAISRISEPDPAIAQSLLLSPNEIHITPKKVGTTNMILWLDNLPVVYDLEVRFDVSSLKQRLHELLPQETELRVIPTNENITLAGRVSSTSSMDQALSITQAFASECNAAKVHNLVEVSGVHQVMLEVRVAEISKSDYKRIGFNFAYTDGTNFVVSMLSGLTTWTRDVNPMGAVWNFTYTPSVNALFGFGDQVTWTGFIDALKEDGIVKVLAKPTLITMSGQNANFLAGGEFPIPVPQTFGSVGIEYKTYGVVLNFLPTVLSPDRINIRVTPEVSELDYKSGVNFSGYIVPGLTVRRTSTTVELGDGQSFAIAGLIRNYAAEDVSRYPFLGDLPILGLLFRSSSFQKSESELVIVVTPRLVKPSSDIKQPLPTDNYIEPNFIDMVFPELNYTMSKGSPAGAGRGTLDGDFGPASPKP